MRVGYTSMGAGIFAKLGAEALDSLPAWVLEQMGNVEDLVEDLAPPGQPNLLGLYEGVPLSATGEMEPKRRFLDPSVS
jgi:predicted Zn-dependent protease with MMP-like domain